MTESTELTAAQLRSMDDYEFEHFVADLWDADGYRAQVTQRSRDGGVDVMATTREERIAIQVKRYGRGNKVGARTVREVSGLLHRDDIDGVAVATSSAFTKPAYREAHQSNVALYNAEDLLRISRSTRRTAETDWVDLLIQLLYTTAPSDADNPLDLMIHLLKYAVLIVVASIFGYAIYEMYFMPAPGLPMAVDVNRLLGSTVLTCRFITKAHPEQPTNVAYISDYLRRCPFWMYSWGNADPNIDEDPIAHIERYANRHTASIAT